MNRRKWLWTGLLAVPLAIAGAVYANLPGRSYTCPITGEELRCERCCPLNGEQSFTCPLTGEELPCRDCCPLN